MSAEHHPVTSLPFVADRKTPLAPGELPRCFWNASSGGDAWADNELGNQYALEYLRYEAALDHNVEPFILPMIIADMPRKLGQIELAFLTVVAISTTSPPGVRHAEHVVDYWRQCREEEEAAKKKRKPRPKLKLLQGGGSAA